MRLSLRVATAALLAVAGAACSGGSTFSPPEPTADVRAEQERLAPLIERDQRPAFGAVQGTCAVRLLGTQSESSFAWAHCEFPGAGGPGGAVSTPFRVDGVDVRTPGDGSQYAKDVRRLFPSRIAAAILDDPDRLRP